MEKAVNSINLIGWIYLQFHVGAQLIFDIDNYRNADITIDVYVLKAVQLFQIVDIILILIGKSKGSLLGAFFQILGRLIVALIFVQPETDNYTFAALILAWSLADIIRYLYYLFKDNALTGLLRYNFFLILYPLGVYAQMMVINNFIKRQAQILTDLHINFIRFVQVCIILGMIMLYTYMLKMRRKYYKKNQNKQVNDEAKVESRSKSPKAKRN